MFESTGPTSKDFPMEPITWHEPQPLFRIHISGSLLGTVQGVGVESGADCVVGQGVGSGVFARAVAGSDCN